MMELDKYRKAVDMAVGALACKQWADNANVALCKKTLAEIEILLYPPVETETVEVDSYATIWPDGSICSLMTQPPENMEASQTLVKLTGTYERPKPQKVERSWVLGNASLLEECGVTGAYHYVRIAPFPTDAPIGKTVTLTATWTE